MCGGLRRIFCNPLCSAACEVAKSVAARLLLLRFAGTVKVAFFIASPFRQRRVLGRDVRLALLCLVTCSGRTGLRGKDKLSSQSVTHLGDNRIKVPSGEARELVVRAVVLRLLSVVASQWSSLDNEVRWHVINVNCVVITGAGALVGTSFLLHNYIGESL